MREIKTGFYISWMNWDRFSLGIFVDNQLSGFMGVKYFDLNLYFIFFSIECTYAPKEKERK